MSEDTSLQSTARQLDALRDQMARATAAAKRRSTTGIVLALVLLAASLGYLWYGYNQFKDVNPDLAFTAADPVIRGYIDESAPQLEAQLRDGAPAVADALEAQARALPDRFAERLMEHTKTQVATHMPELETELVGAIQLSLTNAREQMDTLPGNSDEEKARALLDGMAGQAGDTLIRAIEEFRAKYAAGARDIVAYLDLLASNQGLDAGQQHQRDSIRKFIVLANMYQAESGTTDQTKIHALDRDAAALPGAKEE